MSQRSPIQENSPVQEVSHPLLDESKVQLLIKRDDLIHPDISGNKWRKLKYNIQAAKEEGHDTILTFGGAFSNHIAATAVCASLMGLNSIGVIRGESTSEENATLSLAREHGMQLHFVNRTDYRKKSDKSFIGELAHKWGRFYEVPEGGANKLGRRGCEEILENVDIAYDYATVSIGTGTTFLGMLDSVDNEQKVLGFPAIKGFHELDELLENEFANKCYELMKDYHFGGYAKYSEELITFINEFTNQTGIPLDPIYTGKMMYGIFDLIRKEYFPVGSTVLAVHTGGLQGIAGFNSRFGNLIEE